jgi:hypothetical protein
MSRSLLDMFLSRRFVRLPLFGVLVSLQFVLVLSVFVLCCGGVFALNFCLDSAREWIDVPRGVGHVNMFALAVLLLPVSRSSPLCDANRCDDCNRLAQTCGSLFYFVCVDSFSHNGDLLGQRIDRKCFCKLHTRNRFCFCCVLYFVIRIVNFFTNRKFALSVLLVVL